MTQTPDRYSTGTLTGTQQASSKVRYTGTQPYGYRYRSDRYHHRSWYRRYRCAGSLGRDGRTS